MNWSLGDVAEALVARGVACTLVGDPSLTFARVHTDTRTLQAGDLFVALRGERFDAHSFLPQAAAAGAVAVVSEQPLTQPGLQVSDTRQALMQLAGAWRARQSLPLIAVTGSNGKTTVTQMIASILRAWVGKGAFATQGNFNNDVGVPLTLLRLRQQEDGQWHRAGVVEIGMNHPGEIAPLAAITAPTVALVNNAQREHQEFMASVEATAEENGQVFTALGASGVAVFPADDPCAPIWWRLAGSRPHLTFALQGEADLTADAQWSLQGNGHWAMHLHTPAGELPVALQMPGVHNLRNALAAAACALAAGAPLQAIREGLEAFRAAKGRSLLLRVSHQGQDAALVDDSYNANPDSMRAGVELLAAMRGPRWFLMGDMGEVGTQGPAFHAEVGALVRERGIEHFWAAGPLSAHAGADRHFDTTEQLMAALGEAPGAASLLVKGSRFMGMERVVNVLKEGR
ncbi:MAG: UDP-N-acetylmuramoyl-tripeptide--D-alanyl-D-alanine ligase [Burkholderiales bacterium]|nr:UDP-N-acetylmuramoyl-tripeptide--D-alanyl-D-alanine ligase [Burkholderiales bacterium]